MSARPIGEIIKPIVVKAIGLGRIQEFLDTFGDPCVRMAWITSMLEGGAITPEEADLLIEHNGLEKA